MNKEATRAIVIDVPESQLVKMKEYVESSGHYKYLVHDAAPIYRDMIMFKVINGFHTELEWEDCLSEADMAAYVKQGAVVLLGPRTEPGMWQHPDYTGLSDNGNKLMSLCRESMKMSEEIFHEKTNLVDIGLLSHEARMKGFEFKEALQELFDKGKAKQAGIAYIKMNLCGK